MASTDIQPLLDSQPPALPAHVARVKADGLPTTHLIDWELFQTQWFRNNIVATDTRIDTVKATADDASAAVTTEQQARVSADEALAQQITTVDAKANSATANGQIYFAAAAVPAGAVAAYGIYLTAGNAFTGFEMIARSNGTAAIAMAANQFAFTDSGTAQNVFNYSSGIFTFNVPVRIGTVDILAGAVNAPVASTAPGPDTLGATAFVGLISATHTGASGYVALIHVDFQYEVTDGSGSGVISGLYRIRRSDGVVIYGGQLYNYSIPYTVSHSILDATFDATYTYYLEVSVDSTGPTFTFYRRGLMIDLRKR